MNTAIVRALVDNAPEGLSKAELNAFVALHLVKYNKLHRRALRLAKSHFGASKFPKTSVQRRTFDEAILEAYLSEINKLRFENILKANSLI